uniref:Uncharacterized protein n=1 Tax=Hyaloperonospora arabidopsidis (strain Emoy2) TaxID=559515 RepID=M4BK06_HYAAE
MWDIFGLILIELSRRSPKERKWTTYESVGSGLRSCTLNNEGDYRAMVTPGLASLVITQYLPSSKATIVMWCFQDVIPPSAVKQH